MPIPSKKDSFPSLAHQSIYACLHVNETKEAFKIDSAYRNSTLEQFISYSRLTLDGKLMRNENNDVMLVFPDKSQALIKYDFMTMQLTVSK